MKTKGVLDFLINDLQKFGTQSSWDWEADLRFAEAFGNAESVEILRKVVNGSAPWPVKHSAVKLTGIPQKRMNHLRQLVKAGKVEAYWSGSEEGGKSELGLNRFRNYVIRKETT